MRAPATRYPAAGVCTCVLAEHGVRNEWFASASARGGGQQQRLCCHARRARVARTLYPRGATHSFKSILRYLVPIISAGTTNIFGLNSGPAGASGAAGVSAAFVSSAALASLASVISTMVKKVVVRPSSHADQVFLAQKSDASAGDGRQCEVPSPS